MTIIERYVAEHPNSRRLYERASGVFPDGVTHDMRQTSPFPLYVERAAGAHKYDVDGHTITDYVMGHGSLLLGHQHPAIVEAVLAQTQRGTHYGASHELEIRWGELVERLVPSAERVRFTSSGTEATMMAVRLARAHTGREKIIRLREHFHGWNDSVAGQPDTEGTAPRSAGVTQGALEASIVLPANDVTALERTLLDEGGNVAAMIFEATGAHWGTDQIDLAYVRRARELTREHGVALIFDEVITGFRVSPGGAQAAYGVTPDMTTMAKILGGGLPGGAVAGRAEIIDQIATGGDRPRVSHPGTYNANPLSAAAGATCLDVIADGSHQQRAAETAAVIARGINATFREAGIAGACYGLSSMLHIAFDMERQPADGYSFGWTALPCPEPRIDPATAQGLRLGMINEGFDLMAGGMMVSSAHAAEDAARTIEAFRVTLAAMKDDGLL